MDTDDVKNIVKLANGFRSKVAVGKMAPKLPKASQMQALAISSEAIDDSLKKRISLSLLANFASCDREQSRSMRENLLDFCFNRFGCGDGNFFIRRFLGSL
ncbi:unnamed protein product [Soboliphyme baturini]|uniref:Uncharacterized protein n=1 Tax=Soboliphyme baturini TaxID=241478 RepID=A0A183IME0_9BILA|nr:unnamed protein product [Soboliphyme baturini]